MDKHAAPGSDPANTPKLIAAWLLVGIPFAWGVIKTLENALALFK